MTASVTERVQAGAAFLDARWPRWDVLIVPGVLDIASWSRCVLGQLYGGYSKGVEALGLGGHDARDLGFDGSVHADTAARTQAWRDLIAARQRERERRPEMAAV